MPRARFRQRGMLAAVAGAAIVVASCNLPFGPAVAIERQSFETAYVRLPQPHLEVRAVWRVKNTGDRPVSAIEVRLPDAKTHAVSRLSAESDGSEVAAAPAAGRSTVHIEFREPLAIKAQQEIAVSYALAGNSSSGGGIVVNEAGFVLPIGEWTPALLPPSSEGPFARTSDALKHWDLTFRVPAGFLVYASGRSRGKTKEADSVVFRFQMRREDKQAFAVGGEFQEERISAERREVILWTLKELPQDLAERAAEAARQTAQFYDGEFGALETLAGTTRIIECPTSQPCWPVPGAALPGSEIYRPEFWSSGVRGIDRQLAISWLDFRVHPDWRQEPFPMSALVDYAADLAAVSRAQSGARRQMVQAILADWDGMAKAGKERRLLAVQNSDPEAMRHNAQLKSELFFFALEDAVGSETLHRALQHLLQTYAGQSWHAADLRSALELESGKDLGAVFRSWLTETGIPGEFRSRYASGAEASGSAR